MSHGEGFGGLKKANKCHVLFEWTLCWFLSVIGEEKFVSL